MSKTDFSQPQRMSCGAFFIIFAKLFSRTLTPFITLAFYNLLVSSKHLSFGTILLLCVGGSIAVSLILTLISYLPKRFYIKDGNLIFIHGLINHENTCVPLNRIHSLRTEKGIWFRLLDMRGIIFDTLATREEEIELILNESDWQQLLSLIEKEEKPQPVSASEPPEYNPTSIIYYPTKNLLLSALCQNHLKGMAVVGSVLALISESLNDMPAETTYTIASYLDTYTEELIGSPLKLILLLVTIYIVILILWLGRILLRYYDMIMTYDKKLLTFTYGLLTRASCRFFYDKICTIWVKRNFLEKRFGFCTLILKQALNVSAKKEEDNMKLYGMDSSSFFLNWWLGEDYTLSNDIFTAKSGKGVFFLSVFFPVIIAVAASTALCIFKLYPWLIIPLLYLLFTLLKGVYTMRHSKISLRSTYFIIHNGAFAEMASFIKYSNLEVVRIRKTPFTRWSHRVSLAVATSGSSFFVRSLKEEEAKLIYELLLSKAEITGNTCQSRELIK